MSWLIGASSSSSFPAWGLVGSGAIGWQSVTLLLIFQCLSMGPQKVYFVVLVAFAKDTLSLLLCSLWLLRVSVFSLKQRILTYSWFQ